MSARAVDDGPERVLLAVMDGANISKTESLIIYGAAGGFYLQMGDLSWLTIEAGSPLVFLSPDFSKASLFEADLSSGQTRLSVSTDKGIRTLYYSLNHVTPYLSLNHTSGTFDTFYLTKITPSLTEILADKQCASGDFADVNLAGECLDELDLTEADFSKADLSKTSFAGSILTGCDMTSASLIGVNFSGACLDRANLTACNLTGTDWGKPKSAARINLSACRASDAILGHPGALGSPGTPLNCTGAVLSGATFHRADLQCWNLCGAELTNVMLAEAVLNNVILDEANAQNAVFTRACLPGASLKRIRAQGANFIQAVLNDADLSEGHFGTQDVPFSPNGMPAVFAGASCKNANAKHADFYGVNLQRVNGEKACFNEATLENADLSNGFFAFTQFTEAKVSGADFSGSVLTGANFSGCIIDGGSSNQSCSFQRALLQGVDFEKATLSGVLLTGAEISETEGVPLFDLPPAAETNLTQENLSRLEPEFRQAGNPLNSSAEIKKEDSWEINNCKDANTTAPRAYFVDDDLDVFDAAEGMTVLFNIQSKDQYLLEYPNTKANSHLQSIFQREGYSLANGAPIAQIPVWQIDSKRPEDFHCAIYYPLMRVYEKTGCLVVYGSDSVCLRDWKNADCEDISFNATVITLEQLSENSIGPCGGPRILVGEDSMTWQAYLTSIDRKPKLQPTAGNPALPA